MLLPPNLTIFHGSISQASWVTSFNLSSRVVFSRSYTLKKRGLETAFLPKLSCNSTLILKFPAARGTPERLTAPNLVINIPLIPLPSGSIFTRLFLKERSEVDISAQSASVGFSFSAICTCALLFLCKESEPEAPAMPSYFCWPTTAASNEPFNRTFKTEPCAWGNAVCGSSHFFNAAGFA